MSFQNARYCNGFPTLRRHFDTLDASIHSTVSDVFSLFPYVPVTKMVTVVLGLSPNCDGIADLSMQARWCDGNVLGACKIGSKKQQEREGNYARGGEAVCETRRSKKHGRDSVSCLALEGLSMRSALCELTNQGERTGIGSPAPWVMIDSLPTYLL